MCMCTYLCSNVGDVICAMFRVTATFRSGVVRRWLVSGRLNTCRCNQLASPWCQCRPQTRTHRAVTGPHRPASSAPWATSGAPLWPPCRRRRGTRPSCVARSPSTARAATVTGVSSRTARTTSGPSHAIPSTRRTSAGPTTPLVCVPTDRAAISSTTTTKQQPEDITTAAQPPPSSSVRSSSARVSWNYDWRCSASAVRYRNCKIHVSRRRRWRRRAFTSVLGARRPRLHRRPACRSCTCR